MQCVSSVVCRDTDASESGLCVTLLQQHLTVCVIIETYAVTQRDVHATEDRSRPESAKVSSIMFSLKTLTVPETSNSCDVWTDSCLPKTRHS